MTEDEQKKVQEEMVKLSQQLSDACHGKTLTVIQGALCHLLAQVILHESGNDLLIADHRITVLAQAMKDDILLVRKRGQN